MREAVATGLSASQEDYLEAIHWLEQTHGTARSRDIAARLSVTRASVTGALRQLQHDGLINYDPYCRVTLTETGAAIAENVIRRHAVLRDFLYRVLGLKDATADRFACAIEHAIDDEVRRRLEAFMTLTLEEAPDLGAWLRRMEAERHG
jgi:DtxR family Mn-dependent transcriptional regulator